MTTNSFLSQEPTCLWADGMTSTGRVTAYVSGLCRSFRFIQPVTFPLNKFLEIIEEWKTNLMSLAVLFHFLCAKHVSDINISVIRSLRLCCWITTSVVLFSVRCVLEICCGCCRLKHSFSLQHGQHPKPAAPNLQHTTNWEQDNRCGNSTTQSQAPDDGYINVRNMLST